MSKAILVIDMPKNCFHCKLQDWANCRIVKGCHAGDTRPDWCPLKELPQKKEMQFLDDASEYHRQGYNACIDDILGGSEGNDKNNSK